MVKLLVDRGARIDTAVRNGNTALMWAAFVGNVHIVEYLVSKGAALSCCNADGHNALDLAVSRMKYSCALLLCKSGMKLRSIEEYKPVVKAVFDLEKFLVYLSEEEEVADESIFYLNKSKSLLRVRRLAEINDRTGHKRDAAAV
eukprot:TRINITY_DN2120_c0_g2_i6.p1 TRINITY_DN2120_c0_g2~~TRINITY_DN2120_c0_g2_i6.p1  ORF type:complete len:144 (+),score=33.65 TRINITY_DN2120_c0_g2_i6:326-757(+)